MNEDVMGRICLSCPQYSSSASADGWLLDRLRQSMRERKKAEAWGVWLKQRFVEKWCVDMNDEENFTEELQEIIDYYQNNAR